MDVLGYGTEPIIPAAVIEAFLDLDREARGSITLMQRTVGNKDGKRIPSFFRCRIAYSKHVPSR